MPKTWTTPAGTTYNLYANALRAPHLLISGATGSGKSVIINNLIYTALYKPPANVSGGAYFVLIDTKRTELNIYQKLPHTLIYETEIEKIIKALQKMIQLIEKRFKKMQRKKEKIYSGADIYIFIDEFADLMTVARQEVSPLIQRIAQIGRAARIHLIIGTQSPIAKILPTEIKCNFDFRFSCRTRSAQDSRNILGIAGCEKLPQHGQAYYMDTTGINLYNIHKTSDNEINRLIAHWGKQMDIFDKIFKLSWKI